MQAKLFCKHSLRYGFSGCLWLQAKLFCKQDLRFRFQAAFECKPSYFVNMVCAMFFRLPLASCKH